MLRLAARDDFRNSHHYPLCPDQNGRTPAKACVVECIRSTLQAAGIATTREDPDGRVRQRYGGHCLRVAGAQFLASAGVETSHIMLLGRWSSSAIEKYVQQAALQIIPEVTGFALTGTQPGHADIAETASTACPVPSSIVQPAVVEPASDQIASGGQMAALQEAHQSLQQLVTTMQAEIQALKHAVPESEQNLVVRSRSHVVHLGTDFERDNPPTAWRTKCGWPYGTSNFFRVPSVAHPFRCCRKCFNSEFSSDDSDQAESHDSNGSQSASDSSASSVDDE